MKVVLLLLVGFMGICQYLEVRFNVENYFVLERVDKELLMCGRGYVFLIVVVLIS